MRREYTLGILVTGHDPIGISDLVWIVGDELTIMYGNIRAGIATTKLLAYKQCRLMTTCGSYIW